MAGRKSSRGKGTGRKGSTRGAAAGSTIEVMRLPHGEGLELPAYRTDEAAGLDLVAAIVSGRKLRLKPGAWAAIPTGLALALPPGYEGQVRPRSGLALDHAVTILNAPGTIDADYRGEVKVILINLGRKSFTIERGMRIAQLVVAPVTRARLAERASLSGTARGAGGFGSTGTGAAPASPRPAGREPGRSKASGAPRAVVAGSPRKPTKAAAAPAAGGGTKLPARKRTAVARTRSGAQRRSHKRR